MANLLNFSNWHLKQSDGEKALLVHKDGHSMSIAVKALPRIQRQQIKRMKLSAGGRVNYAEGGEADAAEAGTEAPTGTGNPITINVGAPAAALSPARENNPQPVDNRGPQGAPAARMQAPILPQPPARYANAAPAPVLPVTGNAAPMLSDQTLNVPGTAALEQQAIGQQQQVDTEKAKAQANYEDQYLKQRGENVRRDQENYNELHGHTEEFRKYMMENPINPNAFVESQSTGQKMATAIGLVLGGFKQGFRGGSNPAMDFLNQQIDRNIDAQKKNAENRKTVWGAYKELYGDSVIATNLSKVSANDMLVHEASLMAAKLGTPQAAATANALRAQAGMKNNQLLIESAGRLGTIRTGAARGATSGNAPSNTAPAADANGLIPIEPILHPGAQQLFDGLQWNKTAEKDYDKTRDQLTAAQQADKAMMNLGPTFNKLMKLRTESGRAEKQTESLQDLPFHLGEVIHGPVKSMAYAQPEHRAYMSAQTELLSDLTNAFKGTNVSGEEIKKVVMDNSPVAGDGPKELKQKRDAIEGFIRRSVSTSLLNKFHMTNK